MCDVKKGPVGSCSSTINSEGYFSPWGSLGALFDNQLNVSEWAYFLSSVLFIDLRVRISVLRAPQMIPCAFGAETRLAGVGSTHRIAGTLPQTCRTSVRN